MVRIFEKWTMDHFVVCCVNTKPIICISTLVDGLGWFGDFFFCHCFSFLSQLYVSRGGAHGMKADDAGTFWEAMLILFVDRRYYRHTNARSRYRTLVDDNTACEFEYILCMHYYIRIYTIMKCHNILCFCHLTMAPTWQAVRWMTNWHFFRTLFDLFTFMVYEVIPGEVTAENGDDDLCVSSTKDIRNQRWCESNTNELVLPGTRWKRVHFIELSKILIQLSLSNQTDKRPAQVLSSRARHQESYGSK